MGAKLCEFSMEQHISFNTKIDLWGPSLKGHRKYFS
jgi:hypothetical protein